MRTLLALALLGVVTGFGAVAARGLDSPWLWGHNGYNGAAFAQAARNSLRFDMMAQAQRHGGFEPPAADELYSGHPLMLHAHLVGLFALLGVDEGTARAVPAFYSVLTLVLLYFVVRRGFGWQVSLASTAVYALTPLNLTYANMVNHEQGSIFWCLLLVLFYLRWDEGRRRRDLAGLLAAVTVAAQFDWPAYYIAFFLALHAFVGAARRRSPWWRWREEYTWLAVFSAVVLANFGGFLLWVHHVRDGLGQMEHSFAGRFGMPWSYPAQALRRSWHLHGPLLLVAVSCWTAWTAVRLRRGEAHRGHLLPAVFLGAQIIHSTVFGKAGRFHEYWAYYASPAIAVAAAEVAVSSLRTLRKGLAAHPRARLLTPTLLGAALLVAQTAHAAKSYARFYGTGGSLFHESYRDLRPQAQWARQMRRLYPRGTAEFVIHPSIPPSHLQLLYYLDSPMEVGMSLDDAGPRRVLVADLDDRSAPRLTRHELSELTRRYGIRLFDRRFVAVDTALSHGTSLQLVSRTRPTSVVEAWLAGDPSTAPVRWHEDEEPIPIERLLRNDILRVRTTGGDGGEPFRAECTSGVPFESLAVSSTKWEPTGTAVVGALRPRCPNQQMGWLREEPRHDDEIVELSCGPGDAMVGIVGRSGQVVDSLGLLCERTKDAARLAKPGRAVKRYETDRVGSDGGEPFVLSCPRDSRLVSVLGRAGMVLDAVGVACGRGGWPRQELGPGEHDVQPPRAVRPPPGHR